MFASLSSSLYVYPVTHGFVYSIQWSSFLCVVWHAAFVSIELLRELIKQLPLFASFLFVKQWSIIEHCILQAPILLKTNFILRVINVKALLFELCNLNRYIQDIYKTYHCLKMSILAFQSMPQYSSSGSWITSKFNQTDMFYHCSQ